MARPPFKARAARSVDFSAADAELAETLENLDGAENYASWIFDLLEPYLGPDVLEVGAGHGTFTGLLAGAGRRVVAVDLSERSVEVLRARFSNQPGVQVLHGSIDAAGSGGPYDSALLINVLEHIEDDHRALEELLGTLKPGGRLILWVPAYTFLYSDFDRRIGHHRRYRKSSLRSQLSRCGYEVVDIRYVNAVGAIAWLIVARLLRRTPTLGTTVRLYDRYFVPTLERIERRWQPPFGQSVFAVARRPADQ